VLDPAAPPFAEPRLFRPFAGALAKLLPALRQTAAAREGREVAAGGGGL